jgi:hypothetical protein
MPALTDDNLLLFCFPDVRRKKITTAFDADGSVPMAASCCSPKPIVGSASSRVSLGRIPDGRDPDRVTYPLPNILAAAPMPAGRKRRGRDRPIGPGNRP